MIVFLASFALAVAFLALFLLRRVETVADYTAPDGVRWRAFRWLGEFRVWYWERFFFGLDEVQDLSLVEAP